MITLLKRTLVIVLMLCFAELNAHAQQISTPGPYGVLPSDDQMVWQKMGYYMFIHFGPNTFTDKEWGDGKENPGVFNPTNLDARQWARTAKEAGMKAIIITAKHHDGFCLWPSQYSTHTVRESPWKDGKGDVLKELSEACEEYGLKFGVYLSPWDQNHPAYGTPEYNDIFAKTLEEVLTNYGDIYEVWFDGANGEGPNGKKQVYDWPLFRSVVFKHQPNAIIFSDIGPGTRWIGNESGFAGETNWSKLNTDGFGMGHDAPKPEVLNTGNENGKYWIPGEADVSIRPGWFFSPTTNDKVKTISQLLNIYYYSIGRNANLLLNVPVDREGLIHKNDSTRLMDFREVIEAAFKNNLAIGKNVLTSNTRGNANDFSSENLTDGDFETYWTVDDGISDATLTLDLGLKTSINRLLLQEYIPLGQRVKSFVVEYWNGTAFIALDKQTTIGFKRILTFPTIQTDKVRISLAANATPILSEIQVYLAPEILEQPTISRTIEGVVSINTVSPDPIITYTLDGTDPNVHSKRYTEAFRLKNGGIVKARAFINGGKNQSDVVLAEYDLATGHWKALDHSETMQNTKVESAFDGDSRTVLVMKREGKVQPYLALDLGEELSLTGFTYIPASDQHQNGNIYTYSFYTSVDGQEWTKVLNSRTFGNIKNNPIKQQVLFGKGEIVRFIKLEAHSLVDPEASIMSIAELGVIVDENN